MWLYHRSLSPTLYAFKARGSQIHPWHLLLAVKQYRGPKPLLPPETQPPGSSYTLKTTRAVQKPRFPSRRAALASEGSQVPSLQGM